MEAGRESRNVQIESSLKGYLIEVFSFHYSSNMSIPSYCFSLLCLGLAVSYVWNASHHPPALANYHKAFNAPHRFPLVAVLKSSARLWAPWRQRPCPIRLHIVSAWHRVKYAINACWMNGKDIPAKWISIFCLNIFCGQTAYSPLDLTPLNLGVENEFNYV